MLKFHGGLQMGLEFNTDIVSYVLFDVRYLLIWMCLNFLLTSWFLCFIGNLRYVVPLFNITSQKNFSPERFSPMVGSEQVHESDLERNWNSQKMRNWNRNRSKFPKSCSGAVSTNFVFAKPEPSLVPPDRVEGLNRTGFR